jgi:hypothetical protein
MGSNRCRDDHFLNSNLNELQEVSERFFAQDTGVEERDRWWKAIH